MECVIHVTEYVIPVTECVSVSGAGVGHVYYYYDDAEAVWPGVYKSSLYLQDTL